MTVSSILLVVAFILLLLAACNVPFPKISLGWLGLALWVLSIILNGVK